MADKSAYVIERLSFHSCDVPCGMEPYDLKCLTRVQQLRLNNHKIEVVRENQKYLYKTPEIRAVIQIIMRKLLLERPTHDIQKFIARYFHNSWKSILEEINEYVEKYPRKPSPIDFKKKVAVKDDKRVGIMEEAESEEESVRGDEIYDSFEDFTSNRIIKDILDEIVDSVVDDYEPLQSKRIRRTIDEGESQDDKRSVEKSDKSMDDEDLFFDFGLDFDLDFSGYHEEDEPNLAQAIESSDKKIGSSAGRVVINEQGRQSDFTRHQKSAE